MDFFLALYPRLENRTNRPHVELVSDLPLDGLIREVEALRQSIQMLEDKLDNARSEVAILLFLSFFLRKCD